MKKTLLVVAMASVVLTGCWTGAEVKEMADETKAAAVEAVEQAKATTVEVAEEAKVVALEVKEQVVTQAEAAKAELDALVENKADRTACIVESMGQGYYSGAPEFVAPKEYKFAEFTPAGTSVTVEATCNIINGKPSIQYVLPAAPVVVEAVEEAPAVPVVAPAGTVIESVEASGPVEEFIPAPVSEEQQLEDRVLCANVAKSLGYYTEGGDYNEGSEYEMTGDGVYVVERLAETAGSPMSVATCEIDADGGVTFHIGKA